MSVAIATPAAAETLTVPTGRPAVSDSVAALGTIALQQIGGRDGAAAAIAIEDALRDAVPDQQPRLRVVPVGMTADVNAMLYGSVDSNVHTVLTSKKTKEECSKEDKDGTCTEKKTREIPCRTEKLTMQPMLRLTDVNGALLYSDEAALSETKYFCADGIPPDWQKVRRGLVARLAARTAAALVPARMQQDIRVLEDRKGLDKAAAATFRNALRQTKHDQDGACRTWRAMAATAGNHPSVAFNIGLCAERDGDLDFARQQYQRVATMGGRRQEADAGLQRIADTIRTERQLATGAEG